MAALPESLRSHPSRVDPCKYLASQGSSRDRSPPPVLRRRPGRSSRRFGRRPAMYATQAEAEKAAKLPFNCTGAHKVGNQWMPLAEHLAQHSSHQH